MTGFRRSAKRRFPLTLKWPSSSKWSDSFTLSERKASVTSLNGTSALSAVVRIGESPLSPLPEIGLSMELDRRDPYVWKALSSAVEDLCQSGVKFLALACHTTHYYAPRIQAICSRYETEGSSPRKMSQ